MTGSVAGMVLREEGRKGKQRGGREKIKQECYRRTPTHTHTHTCTHAHVHVQNLLMLGWC